MIITNKVLETSTTFPQNERTYNYFAFEKGSHGIKRLKFTSKDNMIDDRDIFHIEYSV